MGATLSLREVTRPVNNNNNMERSRCINIVLKYERPTEVLSETWGEIELELEHTILLLFVVAVPC